MTAANGGTSHANASAGLRNALAGLEAGTLGAWAMLAWLMIGSAWSHRSVWTLPNLFATTFYGPDAYGVAMTRETWSGLALVFLLYGVAGALWGVCWGGRRRPGLTVIGACAGLAMYALFFQLIWHRANPLIPLYAPSGSMRIAHLLWGGILARSPGYSRRMAELEGPLADQQPAGIRSGEVIL